jgi:cyclophilin family peptidyl-prolyl cis-trans isomerase
MPNTRQKQLQKLAERRAAERRRQRRNKLIVGVLVGALALGGLGFAAVAFLGGDDDQQTAQPEAGPSPSESAAADGESDGEVACDGEKPAAADEEKQMYDEPEQVIDENAKYTATMETSCGTIEMELYADKTPITVNSFVFLAREGFFDGLTFHRVVPGFVIQGGDPAGDGSGGPGYEFENEEVDGLDFDRAGLLAMANAGPDTNGSQFFITLAETPNLNEGYTLFGEVTSGMEAVEAIAALGSGDGPPSQTVYIEKVTIDGP